MMETYEVRFCAQKMAQFSQAYTQEYEETRDALGQVFGMTEERS
ncbi:MAG TPA: hypothetical protein VFO10_23940 [Oligoflexus sp.]|nr:hypothetical protein [Oligoflexus sp.]HET9240336.1 hypothetical protein [Oligoflexus sp.]